MRGCWAALVLIAGATPAAAAERRFTITSFDRIRVDGPYRVTVVSEQGPAARASGSPRALDAVSVRVEGRTLIIRRDSNSAWGGFPGQDGGPVSIAVRAPGLVSASVAGSGDLAVDAMRGARIDIFVQGSGRIALGRVEADRLGVSVDGSGGAQIAGDALAATVSVRGSGDLEGAKLSASDASVVNEGAGTLTMAVRRAARVRASGSGNVTILGTPACTVSSVGSAVVRCGPQQ